MEQMEQNKKWCIKHRYKKENVIENGKSDLFHRKWNKHGTNGTKKWNKIRR